VTFYTLPRWIPFQRGIPVFCANTAKDLRGAGGLPDTGYFQSFCFTILCGSLYEAGMQTNVTYGSRCTAAFLIPLGLGSLTLGVAVPFLLEDPAFAFILMGLPLIATGCVALLHGFSAAFTRIEISGQELKLAVPGWRGFPVPPVRRSVLKWNDVHAVRHRVEVYSVAIPPFAFGMFFPVNVYAIETSEERFILGGKSVPGLAGAVAEIAARSGLTVQYEGQVRTKLVKALLKGTPEWS
jgi:hypothetical protein